MNVEIPGPGSFEAAFAARLRADLDALSVRPPSSWPVMRRPPRIAFATVAAVAVAAALLVGAVGAFAYGSPIVQDFVRSLHLQPPAQLQPAVGPQHTASPARTTPAKTPPTERETPEPTSSHHESPEPTGSGGRESPEPREGSSTSPPPDE